MQILEPSMNELKSLSAEALEELVFRLCERELIESGGEKINVRGSGDINAKDGGIDVLVNETNGRFPTDYVPCKNTGFQVKTNSVAPSKIKNEMCLKGKIRESIIELASKDGAYIIVSSCKLSPEQIEGRIKAMYAVVDNLKNKQQLKIDFYDLTKLHQWMRKHVSVIVWTKNKISKDTFGWQPFDRWSQPYFNSDDQYIISDEPFVSISNKEGQSFPNVTGLEILRKEIKKTNYSVRITGLSGVGKTRFAQALFENTLDSQPLDSTNVIYCDLERNSSLTPNSMVEQIRVENYSPVIVLDNCPSEKHEQLNKELLSYPTKTKLITIDYQMHEGYLDNTIQVEIDTIRPKVATELALKRYPNIGETNAHRIAKFANGNPELTLIVAGCLNSENISLSKLTNEFLINRLLNQREIPNEQIRRFTGVLSLVDSFSLETRNFKESELSDLAELADTSYRELYRAAKILKKKGLVRKRRNEKCSVEPTILANMLASETLELIPVSDILHAFQTNSRIRFQKAFAKRLRYLHDNSVAQEIVKEWLNSVGILDDLTNLSENEIEILRDVAPVYPTLVFEIIEKKLKSKNIEKLASRGSTFRTTIVNLLADLAFDKSNFETCVQLLIEIARIENKHQCPFQLEEKIGILFQPYCSDTNASIEQKKNFVEQLVLSSDSYIQNIGISILNKVLGWPYWFTNEESDFGAQPIKDELLNIVPFNQWYSIYLTLAEKFGTGSCKKMIKIVKQILVRNINCYLGYNVSVNELYNIIVKIHRGGEWIEMWIAIRHLIYASQASNFEIAKSVVESFENLEKILKPASLIGEISAYVLKSNINSRFLDDDYVFGKDIDEFTNRPFKRIRKKCVDLGKRFIEENHNIEELGDKLFERNQYGVIEAFGKGLAKVAIKVDTTWTQLVLAFESSNLEESHPAVIMGFIGAVDQIDREKSRKLLNEVPKIEKLSNFVIELYSLKSFSEQDFENCVNVIIDKDTNTKMILNLLVSVQNSDWDDSKKSKFTNKLIKICKDEEAILKVIELIIYYFEIQNKEVEPQVLIYGFEIAIKTLQKRGSQLVAVDYSLSKFLKYFFNSNDNQSNRDRWCKELFASISKQKYSGLISGQDILQQTAALMPQQFLNCLFDDNYIKYEKRIGILETLQKNGGILSVIDSKTLIQWCQHTGNIEIWKTMAIGIKCLKGKENGTTFTLAQSAKDFLKASPNPNDILDIFVKNLNLWDPIKGLTTDEIELRLNAINELVDCTNEVISKSAKRIIHEQRELITLRRKSEPKIELSRDLIS